MKKGFLVSVAICSLLFMAACGGNSGTKEAAAETKTTAEQPVEQKAEVEAEPAAEEAKETVEKTEEVSEAETEVEVPEAEPEAAELKMASQADQDLTHDYMDKLSPAIKASGLVMNTLPGHMKSWENGEISDAELRNQLIAAKAAFTTLQSDFTKVPVPQVEYAPLHDAISEFHNIMTGMGVDGGKAVGLFIEALDTQDEAKLEEGYDALLPFDDYYTRTEKVIAELQSMTDIE
ncbi:hypothetical protein B9G55_22630 [Saccharibacillus sp. O16]|nr:hypothetical protein B9G55_22630 [Saccharibacillus sp. O16]